MRSKSHRHAALDGRVTSLKRGGVRTRALSLETVVGVILNVHSECAKHAERAISVAVTLRNWAIGLHVFEYEQRGSDRAKYGARVLDILSMRLSRAGMNGVAPRSLRLYRQFYLAYPGLGRRRFAASSNRISS